MKTCLICGASLEGRRRDTKTCSPACRQTLSRRGLAESRPSERVEPSVVPTKQRKPSLDDIARLILTLGGLEASFRFASQRAEFRLRPLCHRIADALDELITKEGLR